MYKKEDSIPKVDKVNKTSVQWKKRKDEPVNREKKKQTNLINLKLEFIYHVAICHLVLFFILVNHRALLNGKTLNKQLIVVNKIIIKRKNWNEKAQNNRTPSIRDSRDNERSKYFHVHFDMMCNHYCEYFWKMNHCKFVWWNWSDDDIAE